ncbi:putative F-box/LRR-repeat/kelch-repeat protein At1g11620 [Salvia miltiorrhiza]|uniref:putative F-box/LRR-repeat/kelch-repeat protein At1g11620 n=1 Tax=Salvia miltiorrhiza TaxID=226208 RepID=UPI0025AB8CE3|nr:putative F-box/LRR-repeat/kelch-repeat protein At1g11620 [Salvia miltiorrhiza]
MKLLDPPQMRHYSDAIINFMCSGFGYDHKSDDYKVVRIFDYLYHYCTVKMKNPCRYCRGGGKTEMKVEVFSLKTDSWKQIKVAADFDLDGISSSSCNVNGSYYWIKLNHRDDTLFHYSVVSFDFTRECFSNISLPPIHKDKEHDILVKVHDDMVGVIRYERASQSFGVVTTFRLLVLKESSWIPWVCVDLCDVERPLMLHQGRFLFLKKKNSEGMEQLVVYDLETKKLEDLDIYDYLYLVLCLASAAEGIIYSEGIGGGR